VQYSQRQSQIALRLLWFVSRVGVINQLCKSSNQKASPY